MILDLDAETRNEIAAMCYARWSAAYDNWKHVKDMTWENNKHVCPKSDWPDFHASMLDNALKEFQLSEKLKQDICPFSPLIKGE
jgi:hypothetical protein